MGTGRLSFLWNDPLWLYGVKTGFAEKQFVGLRKIVFSCFFRACLDCFHSTQNQYVARVGNLKHCFTPMTWWKLSPAAPGFELATLRLEDRHSTHCARGILPPYSLSELAARGREFSLHCGCKKKSRPDLFFPAKPSWTSESIFQALICFPHFPPWEMKWNESFSRGWQGSSPALLNFFSRPEKMFFGTALVKLIDARLR